MSVKEKTQMRNSSLKKGMGMLIIFVVFFVIQLIVRRSIAVFELSFEEFFNINATEYGFARSIYNIGYGFMQIPLGNIAG